MPTPGSNPTLALGVSAPGRNEIEALAGYVRELKTELGELKAVAGSGGSTNLAGLDSLVTQVTRMRREMTVAVAGIRTDLAAVFKGARDAVNKGADEVADAQAKAAARLRVQAKALNAEGGIKYTISGVGLSSADSVKQLQAQVSQRAEVVRAGLEAEAKEYVKAEAAQKAQWVQHLADLKQRLDAERTMMDEAVRKFRAIQKTQEIAQVEHDNALKVQWVKYQAELAARLKDELTAMDQAVLKYRAIEEKKLVAQVENDNALKLQWIKHQEDLAARMETELTTMDAAVLKFKALEEKKLLDQITNDNALKVQWVKFNEEKAAALEAEALAYERQANQMKVLRAKYLADQAAARQAELDAEIAYNDRVLVADAAFLAATERNQIRRTILARAQLDQGRDPKAVTERFGGLAVDTAQASGGLNELRQKLDEVTKSSRSAHGSVIELGGGLRVTAGVTREAGTLLEEGLAGNFGRMRQSAFAFLNQLGVMKGLVEALLSPLGLLTVAIIGIATAHALGEREVREFNNTMQMTGGIAGITRGQFDELAHALSNKTYSSIGTAKEALMELTKTGRFTSDGLAVLGQAAISQSHITGESLESIAKDYAKMPDGVYKWAEAHNKSMHFMTEEELGHIHTLEQHGKGIEALLAVGEKLNTHMHKEVENLGILEKAWRGFKNVVSEAKDALLSIGRDETTDEKLKKARQNYAAVKAAPVANKSEELEKARKEVEFYERLKEAQEGWAKSSSDAAVANEKASAATDRLAAGLEKYNRAAKERKALEDLHRDITEHNAVANSQPFDAINNLNGVITPEQQRLMENDIRSRINGARSGADGVRQVIQAEYQAENALATAHFREQKTLLDEQYHNEIITAGQYYAQSLVNYRQYQSELLVDLEETKKKRIDQAEKEKAALSGANLSDREKVRQAATIDNRVRAETIRDEANAQKALTAARTADDKILDDYIGKVNRFSVANDKYWGNAEQGIKKEAALAKMRHDLADASDEERARAEAMIKVEESHSERLREMQVEADKATKAADDFKSSIDFTDDNAVIGWMVLQGQADRLAEKLAEARKELEKLKGMAADSASLGLEYKKDEELRGQAKKLGETVKDKLADAILSGGKSGFKDMIAWAKDYLIKRPLKWLLQLMLQPVQQGITNFALNAAGLGSSSGGGALGSAASSAGGSMIGNMFSAGGTLGSLGAFGGAASSGFSMTMAGATGEAVSGAVSMMSSATGLSSFMAGAGQIIGALGPYAIALVAAYELSKSFKGETRAGGQYAYSFDGQSAYNARRGSYVGASGVGSTFLEGPSGGDPNSVGAKQLMNATVQSINDTFAAFGSALKLTGYQGGYESSDRGRGGVFSGGTLSSGATFGESGRGDNYAGTLYETTSSQSVTSEQAWTNFVLDTKQSMIEALQAAGEVVPKTIRDMIQLDAEKLSDDEATKLLDAINTTVTGVSSFRKAITALPFDQLKTLSFDAAAALVKFAGGADALVSKLQSYYTNFYTAPEQRTNVASTISQTLKQAGINVTSGQVLGMTRAQYRSIVDTVDTSTDSGLKLYNTLLDVGNALASIVGPAEDSTTALQDTVDGLKETVSKFKDFGKNLREFRDSLLLGELSPLTPAQKYAQAAQKFHDTYNAAMGGDEDALSNLQNVSQDFLNASRDYNASNQQYTTDFSEVQTALTLSASKSDSLVTIAQSQLTIAQAQLTALTTLATTTDGIGQEIVDAIKGQVTDVSQHGTPVEQVTALYQSLLQRAPDAGGLSFWTDRMAEGVSISDIANSIKSSQEYLNLIASGAGSGTTPPPITNPITDPVVDTTDGSGWTYQTGGIIGADSPGGYAKGGFASGLSIVGEEGPELVDFKTPGRVYTASQTAGMFAGSDAMVSEMRALREEVKQLREQHGMGVQAQIAAAYDSNDKAADKIVDGAAAGTSRAAWSESQKATLE
jgi:hypothetical protein